MHQGYIKLHRKIQDNELWIGEKFDKARAWIDMILLANHKDGMFFKRGVEVHVKRGQLAWSEVNLAKKWGWSRDKVRRFFTWLKTRQQIRQQKNHIISIVTIVNYEEYQENKTTDNTTEKQQTIQQKNTNNNNKEEYKNVKNEKDNKNTTNILITFYCDLFKLKYNSSPYISPKDSGIIKRLSKIKDIKAIFKKFFESTDDFITKNRHAVNIIESQINKLSINSKEKENASKYSGVSTKIKCR